MKNTSKILALVLVVMTVLMSLSAITASAATETVTKVFDPNTMEVASGLSGSVTAGTDGFFTLYYNNSKYESGKSHEFGAAVNNGEKAMRFSLNGSTKFTDGVPSRAIGFTVDGPATVTVYWQQGNDGERALSLYGSDFAEIQSISQVKGYYTSTFELTSAGTYYLGHASTIYFFLVEVSWEVELCSHEGGTATCKDQAVCTKCGASYGELSTEHNYADGACTVCGTPDPNACNHENMAPATCTAPKTCECGYTEGEALGHDMVVDPAVAPTCTEKGLEEGSHCSRCDEATTPQKEVAALGHTLTFVNTLPTAEAAGKTIADCSVCNEHFDFGEVNVMTPGTYVLDAKDLAGIAQYSLFDGEVKVVGGVFACHLSYKYRTDENVKTFPADDWTSTHRMNFGGASEFCNNGEGEAAVRNGGLKNYVQIVTTAETTISIHWVVGGDGREIGVYDMNGELVAVTEFQGLKNDLAYSTLTVPAGAYLIGSAAEGGGSYFFKVTVDVVAPHEHDWSDATCTEPSKCECGETQGEALGHDYAEGVCTRCEAADPDYVAPQPPVEGGDDGNDGEDNPPVEEPEMNFFQKIIAWIMDLINKILAIFKK